MTPTRRRLTLMGALLSLFTASPVWAWHISGQVFCDQNGNQGIDAGDTPIGGVGILITALTVAPGGTFPATTGSGGVAFTVALPDHEDDYRVELTGVGLPAGAHTLVPSSGAYGVPIGTAIHLQPDSFAGTANFLVDGCVATPSPSATPTLVASNTPPPSATTTPVPGDTQTPVPSDTATPVPSDTATPVPSDTATPVPSDTATPVPSDTATPVPSDTATPVPSLTPDAALTEFQCYEVDRSTAAAITGVSVVDRFGAALIDLAAGKRVKRLCNPAIVGSSSTTPPTVPDHLVGYVISQRTPLFSPITGQTVVNQFGTIVITVVRPAMLLVPSAKSLSAPPPPPDDPLIDHFQCYTVKGGRTRMAGVHVVDQFGTMTFDLKRPTHLCTAVDKRGEGVLDPTANLLCYNVRPSKGTPTFRGPGGPVFVANQFGSDTLRVNHARELCVRSSVNPD